MKKYVFLLLGILMCIPLQGQDTITENDSCYMFWPHSRAFDLLDTVVPHGNLDWFSVNFWENMATPGTLVYGVSLRGFFPLDSSINVSLAWKGQDLSYHYFDTAYLDSSVLFRYLKYRVRLNYHSDESSEFGENCNEIYFHRPWAVPDTFYVVIRDGDYPRRPPYGRIAIAMSGDSVCPQRHSLYSMNENGEPVYFNSSGCDTSNAVYFVEALCWYEFPILEPNRARCGKPTGLHLTGRGDTWTTLAWNGGSGDSYRVTVEGPDSTFVMETTDTTLTLLNLVPDAFYRVYLQSLCRYQYYDFDSSFVNPGRTGMGFRTNSIGVDESDFGQEVALRPNPASHRVDVTATVPMKSIEVVDDLGRVVASYVFVPQNTFAFDVSPLPAGVYLLRIHTPAGTATKKLLVR